MYCTYSTAQDLRKINGIVRLHKITFQENRRRNRILSLFPIIESYLLTILDILHDNISWY